MGKVLTLNLIDETSGGVGTYTVKSEEGAAGVLKQFCTEVGDPSTSGTDNEPVLTGLESEWGKKPRRRCQLSLKFKNIYTTLAGIQLLAVAEKYSTCCPTVYTPFPSARFVPGLLSLISVTLKSLVPGGPPAPPGHRTRSAATSGLQSRLKVPRSLTCRTFAGIHCKRVAEKYSTWEPTAKLVEFVEDEFPSEAPNADENHEAITNK